MDRTELIAHIEEQIAHIGANVPADQGGSAAVRNLEGIVAALGEPGAKGAVGAAEKLVRDVEELGGVARGMNAGPRDEREVIVYGSEAARDNHQYALRLLALVREVVGDSSAVNGAAGGTPEAEAAPGVVTAEQWMRAFDSAGSVVGAGAQAAQRPFTSVVLCLNTPRRPWWSQLRAQRRRPYRQPSLHRSL